MSEFEKEIEKNMKLNKVAYERENIYSDFLVSKRDIERIFHDWQPPKPLVEVPELTQKQADTLNDYKNGSNSLLEYLRVEVKKKDYNRFARAWIDGYTVEKEQLYEVVFYVDEEDDRCLLMKTGKTISFEYESQNEGHYQQQFTEAEIKAIDKRYWVFAVPVEEVKP